MKVEWNRRNQLLLLAGLALLMTLPLAGNRALWDPDEGRYAESAREMLASGDWLTPQLNFQPHLTKPPMTYWLVALGLKLFGTNEFGARIFLPLAFCGTVLLTAGIAYRLGKPDSAFASGVVFLSSLLPFIGVQVLTTDLFLTFFETLAVFFMCGAVHPSARRPRRWVWAFYAALGAAFLTKGPPGLLPPLGAALGFWIARRPERVLRRFLSPIGLLLFAGIGFGWYLAIAARHPHALQYFIGQEVVGRVFTTMHGRNNPWYIYIPVLLLGPLPWTPYLVQSAREGVRRYRSGGRRWDPFVKLLAVWIALPLVVFCIARSRLVLYVLPLFVPISLWAGDVLAARWRLTGGQSVGQIFSGRRRRLLAGWLLFLVVAAYGVKFVPSRQNIKPVAEAALQYASGRPFEISIVSHNPRWGLSFYLQHPHSNLVVEDPPGAPEEAETFQAYVSRLDAERPMQLFVVKRSTLDWAQSLSRFRPEIFYHDDHYVLFSIAPQAAPSKE